jgi:hypothetical protein
MRQEQSRDQPDHALWQSKPLVPISLTGLPRNTPIAMLFGAASLLAHIVCRRLPARQMINET